VASALLGWRWGLTVGAGLTLGLAMVVVQGWPVLEDRDALSAVLLSAAAVFLSWMTTRPTRTALDCASRCYDEAQMAVQELRGRQAELASFGKSLSVFVSPVATAQPGSGHARKAAHEARQLKAKFAAAVSHELRTPLNLIIGFCEMMVLSPAQAYGRRLPAGFRDDLEAIYRNACHLSALVDDILDLSQVDADRMALQREWTTLEQVVDEAMAPLGSLFRDRGLYLRTAVGAAARSPPLLRADVRDRQSGCLRRPHGAGENLKGVRDWLGDDVVTFWVLVLVQFWQWMGLPMVIYLAGLQNVPEDLTDAARIDGANEIQAFRYVTFPMLAPAFTVVTGLSFIVMFRVFDIPFVIAGPAGACCTTCSCSG
jgi:hypothetical protein